jgi:hypothetical protein
MDTQTSSNGSTTSTQREPLQQALDAGRDIQAKAADLVGASAEVIKKQTADLVDVAKIVAAEAGDRMQSQVERQKQAGVDYVERFADTMRRAASEFEAETPIAATYIRKAAAQIENVAESIREGELRDLVRGAQSFAQRQPTAFLGLAVLAGFGAIRFLKSSATEAPRQESDFGAREAEPSNFGASP